MDNEDKVKGLVEKSKSFFLRETVSRSLDSEGFQLDREFAKTRKNRSMIVLISIVVFIAIFTAGAVLVTLYIQRESKRVPVNIEAFQDVNLKEVLDRAKKFDNQMKGAKRELSDLQTSMEQEVTEVRREADRQIELVNVRNLSRAETARQVKLIRDKADAQITSIQERYKPLFKEKEADIAQIQENIDSYDAKMVEQARNQEEVLNNQQRRFELEMEETVTYYETRLAEVERQWKEEVSSLETHYESLLSQINRNHADEIDRLEQQHADEIADLKRLHAEEIAVLKRQHADEVRRLVLTYNPVFDSGEISKLLAATVDPSIIGKENLNNFSDVLAEEGIISRADFDRMYGNIEDMALIMEKLKTIPFENSVPSALRQLEYRNWLVFRRYDAIWQEMAEVIEDKNEIIEDQREQLGNYRYALETLVAGSRENGYVLDPRDKEDIIVFLAPIHAVKEGDYGYVFREDDHVIGTIEFLIAPSGKLRARLVGLESDEYTIQPFDKILIQVE
jgi:hypothetical protein